MCISGFLDVFNGKTGDRGATVDISPATSCRMAASDEIGRPERTQETTAWLCGAFRRPDRDGCLGSGASGDVVPG